MEASFSSKLPLNTFNHKWTYNKNFIRNQLHKYYNVATYKVTIKSLWIIAMCAVTIIKVLLHATLSRLKFKVNWKLISNCTRLIVIKFFYIFSHLLHNCYQGSRIQTTMWHIQVQAQLNSGRSIYYWCLSMRACSDRNIQWVRLASNDNNKVNRNCI